MYIMILLLCSGKEVRIYLTLSDGSVEHHYLKASDTFALNSDTNDRADKLFWNGYYESSLFYLFLFDYLAWKKV